MIWSKNRFYANLVLFPLFLVRQTITNPSIGETSVGGLTMASLTESHASNNDRADGDGASTTAIAGKMQF